DGSVNLPFRRAVETYINSLPLFTNCKLKKQKTSKGQIKMTNRLDDILELTNKGRDSYSGLGECKSECPNFYLKNNLKNDFDMHKCAVQIIMKVMLSDIEEPLPVQLVIKNTYRSLSIPAAEPKLGRINLSLQTCDMAIAAHCGHRTSGTEIALKVLFPYNNADEINLRHVYKSGKDLCNEQQLKRLIKKDDHQLYEDASPWTILNQLLTSELKIQGKVLYYQCQDVSASKNSPEYYYQLTLSDKLWLSQGCDYGQFCFGIDVKYDLNNEDALVLFMIIKDQAGYSSPLAFGFSNKENHYTIQLAVQAVKANIPCNNPHCMHQYRYIDLPDGRGFKHICECILYWNPLAMIDKHRPTKLALQNLVRGTILCWFHIIKSDNEAAEMGNEYKKFIYFLPLDDNVKNLLIRDLEMNWICNEWRQGFIDGGREPQMYALTGAKPMTTNNLTERMNKTIESWHSGIQTVLSFIECLYGVKFIKKSLVQSELGETLSDVEVSKQIDKMIIKLINHDNINIPASHYLINISTNKCICYDYVWNGSFRDACKHIYAARIYIDLSRRKLQKQDIKEKLVEHFKNKERAIASENKNYLIYNRSSEQAYQEILRLFNAVDYTCDTENINAYDDEYDDSFAESAKYAQSDEYKELPPSVHRQNTTRIRNKHRASTQSVGLLAEKENNMALAMKRSLE
ncbi:15642_t:CDS:2, partial [Cetraspora pellucida]